MSIHLFKFLSGKIKKSTGHRNTQTGRSMIEILGVLAIIGVLSLGGLVAYRISYELLQIQLYFSEISQEVNEITTSITSSIFHINYVSSPLPDHISVLLQ